MAEEPQDKSDRVLVVGAGPVGLSAALALAAQGQSCRLIERRTAPSELSRAVGIMPETIDKLRALGAGDAIEAEGMALRKIVLKQGSQTLAQLETPKAQSQGKVMIGLPQNRTEDLLHSALKQEGGQVDYGLSLEKISLEEANGNRQKAVVRFSDGSQESYDWVIAADGLHSTVRQQLGIAYPGYDLTETWSIADVEVEGAFDCEQVTLFPQGPNGVVAIILPIKRQRARVVSSTPDALAALPVPLPIRKIHRTGTFQISVRQAERYQQGPVLLAGDAAHCHSPVGGMGMNLGIDDALAAAHAILTGNTADYSAARHKLGANILRRSEAGRKVASADSTLARFALRSFFRLAGAFPPFRQAFIHRLTHLT